jgi:NNP family nitrate/nitrite transporter-like MFS transporter
MFPLFFLTMATLGVGNGAVFQLVPQRFRHEIGVMTGLVGFGGGWAASISLPRSALPSSGPVR